MLWGFSIRARTCSGAIMESPASHWGIGQALMITLGFARLVNGEANHKATLRRADFRFVKGVLAKKRMEPPLADDIEKLLF